MNCPYQFIDNAHSDFLTDLFKLFILFHRVKINQSLWFIADGAKLRSRSDTRTWPVVANRGDP